MLSSFGRENQYKRTLSLNSRHSLMSERSHFHFLSWSWHFTYSWTNCIYVLSMFYLCSIYVLVYQLFCECILRATRERVVRVLSMFYARAIVCIDLYKIFGDSRADRIDMRRLHQAIIQNRHNCDTTNDRDDSKTCTVHRCASCRYL